MASRAIRSPTSQRIGSSFSSIPPPTTDTPMPETPPRRRSRAVNQPEGRTHDEIYTLVEESGRQSAQALQASAEIKALLTSLTASIGTESQDEYGDPVGTGVVGRLMRLERDVQRRFATWDGWVKTATGAIAAATVLGGVLWWLLGERLGALLK